MAKRTAWLYVGLPHTGGPAVARAMTDHADMLRAHGVGLPASSPAEMRRASTELLHDHQEQGLRRRDVEGAWAAVCRRAWRDKRSPLLGDERLVGARDDQIALVLDGLAGLRPRAVVALRDPATLLVEDWRTEVREGRTTSFARYAERVLDPDAEHPQAARFWSAHDLPAVLDRWVAALGPDRVHVLVLPPGGDPGDALWGHLLGLLGLNPDLAALTGLTPPTGSRADPGDAAHTAVLRQVNDALKGRLPRKARRDLLADWLPAPAEPAEPPALPEDVTAETTAWAEKWRARVAESGVDVRGRLDDLLPATPDPGRPGPDEVSAAGHTLATRALGDATLEVAHLRDRVAELEDRNEALDRKRTRLKRRVAHLGG